jgi:Ca2+-binding EF-hand superfamily protein
VSSRGDIDGRRIPMLTPKFIAASMIVFGLAGPLAFAREETRQEADVQFEQLDRNGDGFLARDETATFVTIEARFERFDVNRDGRLDRCEFRALIASLK